jgi:hypothetical protein
LKTSPNIFSNPFSFKENLSNHYHHIWSEISTYESLNKNVIDSNLLPLEFANAAACVKKFIIKDSYAFIYSNNQREENGFVREKQGNGKRVKRKPFNSARIAFAEVKKNLAKPPASKEISEAFLGSPVVLKT